MNFNKYYPMHWNSIGYWFGLLFFLFFYSCALKDDADFDFPKSQNNLMVEAYLCPNENYQLILMQSNNLDEELLLNLNWNAKVHVSKESEEIQLLNILNRNENSLYMYNYGTDQKIPASYSGEFKLEIETSEGEYVVGSTSTLTQIHINEVDEHDKLIDVSFLNDTEESQRFYFLLAEGICEEEFVSESEYLDFTGTGAGMVKAQLKGEFSSWESVSIKLHHITKENFEFQQSIIDARSANSDPFTVPTKINSNLDGAIGIFTYYTVDSLLIR